MRALTHDSISLRNAGVVHMVQPRKGHRFTLDSILLADFCRVRPRDRVLEPGSGTGIVSLLLAMKFPKARFCPVEIQPDLAALCRGNIEANGLAGNITLVEGDIRMLKRSLAPGTFDVIAANPPYTKFGAGRKSPVTGRQAARQDQSAGMELWLDLRSFLKNRGRYFLVFPAARAAELIALMRAKKLEPKRVRLVHPFEDKPASLVLIEAVKAAGPGLDVLPPLIVHDRSGGGYTKEMKDIYGLS